MMSTHQTTARSMPALVMAAAAALALALAMLAGSQGGATAEEAGARSPMGPMQERAHRHADVDPEQRATHLAELAGDLGVDADALADAMATMRAGLDEQRATMHEDLAGLDRDARRAAMSAFAEERRGLMAEALVELGVDPEAIAQHRAEHDHGERAQRQQRGAHGMGGPQGMAGPHGRA